MGAYILLIGAQVLGLLMIPFGLPGTWVQIAALTAYAWMTDFRTVGWVPIVVVVALAIAAEVIEFSLGGKYARKYGGSKRAAWGAILGGIVGAVMGVPIPIVGSVIGAFVGSFVGAAAFEYTAQKNLQPSLRAGWGALIGRLAATAVKTGIGVAVLAISLFAALG